MSNAALTWTLSQSVSMRDKMVLTVLVAHADDAGDSAPSMATLTAEASLSERSVQEAIKALAGAELIVVTLGGGRARTNSYRLKTPQTSATTEDINPAIHDMKLGNMSQIAGFIAETPQSGTETPQSTTIPSQIAGFIVESLPSPLPAPSPPLPFPPTPPLTIPTTSPPFTPTNPENPAAATADGSDLFGSMPFRGTQPADEPQTGKQRAGTKQSPPAPLPGERGSGRKAQVPEDWWPSPAGIAFAAGRGIDHAVEVERFVTAHRSKGNLFADIAAAWRTWCLSPYTKAMLGQPNGQSNGQRRPASAPSKSEQRMEAMAALMGYGARDSPPGSQPPTIDLDPDDWRTTL